MKLTTYIRDAFVRAAINDVPQTDYKELTRDLVLKEAVAKLPPAARQLWNNADTRGYIRTTSDTFGCVYTAYPHNSSSKIVFSPEVQAKIAEFERAYDEQHDKIEALRSQLKGAAMSVTTRKALAELLPEFEKYLPPDQPAALRTLPVVQNIVADFTKAGWPKGKQSAPVEGKRPVLRGAKK